jgi:arginine/lysine/ornithine decarboxylase
MGGVFASGATLYSAFGSTSAIQAMLALFCGPGSRIVMARGCHVSALRALALLDATPVWVPLRGGAADPRDVAAALARSGAKAVYLTSPDYYGRLADVAAIADVCHAGGAVLLVDNAHGAYLRFFEGAADPRVAHPLTLGADAVADSAHKTLPCLTPAALLHLRDGTLAGRARTTLNLFSSTSPSYLVLASLDWAADALADAPPDFVGAAQRLARAAAGFPAAAAPCGEPLKLCLRPARAGVEPRAFHDALLAAGIAPEYFDGQAVVLMASPWNTAADFERLHQALEQLSRVLPRGYRDNPSISPAAAAELPLPEVACPVRQALFGPRQRLSPTMAAGRVCAGLDVPCPPGVPLVAPGEVISPALAEALAAGGITAVDVLE